jgi:hypothetical protein
MAKAYTDIDKIEEYLDVEELESVKTALAFMLLKGTGMDADTVYSLVFQDGSDIIWH